MMVKGMVQVTKLKDEANYGRDLTVVADAKWLKPEQYVGHERLEILVPVREIVIVRQHGWKYTFRPEILCWDCSVPDADNDPKVGDRCFRCHAVFEKVMVDEKWSRPRWRRPTAVEQLREATR